MRSDYLLYILAILFFVVAALSANLEIASPEKIAWVVVNLVLGLVTAGFGYHYRPRTLPTLDLGDVHVREAHLAETEERHYEPTAEPLSTTPIPMQEYTPTPLPAPTPVGAQPAPLKSELMEVKGIGEKRAAQLQALGITRVDDLARASAEDLARGLTISPKITQKWVEKAKELQNQT